MKTHEDRIKDLENNQIASLNKKVEDLTSRLNFVTGILIRNGLYSDSDECSVKELSQRANLHEQTIYKYLKKPKFANTFKQQGRKIIIFYTSFMSVLQRQA